MIHWQLIIAKSAFGITLNYQHSFSLQVWLFIQTDICIIVTIVCISAISLPSLRFARDLLQEGTATKKKRKMQ